MLVTVWVAWFHAGATLALIGLVWFVQLVHYPLFGAVGGPAFRGYHRDHVRRTGWIAAPLMLAELATGLAIAVLGPSGAVRPLIWIGLALVGIVWFLTFVILVPQHRTLGAGYDRAAHRSLLRANWYRTAAWSVRAPVVFWIAASIA